ncbi:YdcF family protein [Actinokineospora bangkokensis]|uniref:DUF218 domain-containing protein n=1 Tax=Actinokineospora bangkokensis TaxID=1193682 RepID=A0A1Q9LGH7_9PSEU|nr:YdcF family protein [Actinokineospora bangkokensis]OLR91151.1 hypothetical protein BJP25_29175 [Actinokineospora bangkokensis]
MIPEGDRAAVEVLWNYHDLGHVLEPTDVGIGLGSHDLGVATCAAQLWHQGMFPRILFTGANAPTTVDRFPRGEAVHYREQALRLGVPGSVILVEPRATNTAENITYARELLASESVPVQSVTLITRPYQQRRAYATCRKLWPEVEVLCASLPLTLDDYVNQIGDAQRMINMLVGDTQRIRIYAEQGYAIPQDILPAVEEAFSRLVAAGFTTRLISRT